MVPSKHFQNIRHNITRNIVHYVHLSLCSSILIQNYYRETIRLSMTKSILVSMASNLQEKSDLLSRLD